MNLSAIFQKAIAAIILVFLFQPFYVAAQEEVVFNETIDWAWSPISSLSYGGNSFYWWHRSKESPWYVTNYGDMPSNDWTTPYNYAGGKIYLRFEVEDMPTSEPFSIQMGIWQDKSSQKEAVSGRYLVSGGEGASIEINMGSLSGWHNVFDTDVDFKRPEDFYRIGLILWKGSGSCIPMAQGWTNSAQCANSETEQAKFFPMRANVTVVAVAAGHTFSGWDNYPVGGSTKPPTPTYGIDYTNEETNKVVPATDEYAYSSNMSGAISGTGEKLALTPGQDVYFRTKAAAGGVPASNIQTLDVPSRPAAPAFTYDAANQRTSQTISSAYEYSDSPSMTSATTGSGTYVSFPLGTTKYFRKKATASAFKSAIQSLYANNPPAYTIDYTNERTATAVASTDEYSYNNSSWTSGSGNYLALTPGQTVYFRKKASPADVQTLAVPARPAAPTFKYDAANQRTTTIVSSAYEYSSAADMSGAITGSGSYVSFGTGATMYFRKKATSGAFKSNIQSLTGTSAPTGSSEFVILNDVIDWPNYTDTNGFYFFYHNENMPVDWLEPYDFYNGQIYTRFEIISQASSTPVNLQFGIWQKLPPETGTLYETMGPQNTMNGPGSVVTKNNSPSGWWKLNGQNIDWTQMDKVWHFGINPWKNATTQIRQENAEAWAERYTYWYPMQVRAIVVAVADGYTFSGWNNYLNAGTVPDFTIDYQNSTTAENITSSYEYSPDQSTWTVGDNTKLPLTPGQDMYFRMRISPSLIQHLVVPARESAPAFTIDYLNEKTTEEVSALFEYATASNMSSVQPGNGAALTLTPGTDLYIRKAATASSFASAVQHLEIPARPAAPQVTINYISESTSEMATGYLYSSNADFSGALTGNGMAVAITPGTNLYIRKPATVNSFSSVTQTLSIPSRPATPAFDIDYVYETTNQTVSSAYLISGYPDMTNSFPGTGAKLTLMPGSKLYIQQKATSSTFKSEIQTLDIPKRPVLSLLISQPVTVNSVPVGIDFGRTVSGLTAEDLMMHNGSIDSIALNNKVYVKPLAEGQVRVSLPANIVNEGNFTAFTLAFNYQLPTGIQAEISKSLKVYPTLVKDILYVEYSEYASPVNYEIYNANGAVILNGTITQNEAEIPVTGLARGLYMLKLTTGADNYTQPFRFIKE